MKKEFTRLVQMMPTLKNDPYVKKMVVREQQKCNSAKVYTMNQFPMKSGWIMLLQNRIGINTIGNLKYQTKVYYDCRTRMVGTSKGECSTPFQSARLKNHQRPGGWMEL